jgi:hypothetical protein
VLYVSRRRHGDPDDDVFMAIWVGDMVRDMVSDMVRDMVSDMVRDMLGGV